VTPLGVVFLFMLVNWWVEKHQRFLFNVYKRFFFYLGHVFLRFLTFFIFFLERFFTSTLLSVTHGQCDARPVTFPAARHHRPLTGTKLYCLVKEAHVC